MAKKEYEKIYKMTARCPYCGEALYEDEMCRCQFEDEVEIRTEVAIRTEVTIRSGLSSSHPESKEIAASSQYCGYCGRLLAPGESCSCKSADAKHVPKHAIPKAVKSAAEPALSGSLLGKMSAVSPKKPETTPGLKSTMRKETGVSSAEATFHRTGKGFLNKANDLD